MDGFRNIVQATSIALLLATSFAQAQERGPLNLARASYFFAGAAFSSSDLLLTTGFSAPRPPSLHERPGAAPGSPWRSIQPQQYRPHDAGGV